MCPVLQEMINVVLKSIFFLLNRTRFLIFIKLRKNRGYGERELRG